MPDPECTAKGIPSHLHRNGRPVDNRFADDEHLYTRVRRDPKCAYPPDWIIADMSTSKDNSTVREKYSASPEDARIDGAGKRYPHFAIGRWQCGTLGALRRENPEAGKTASIQIEHTPMQCQYPHTDVRVLCNGQPTTTLPKTLKSLIREDLASHVEIVAMPLAEEEEATFNPPSVRFEECFAHLAELMPKAKKVVDVLEDNSNAMQALNTKLRGEMAAGRANPASLRNAMKMTEEIFSRSIRRFPTPFQSFLEQFDLCLVCFDEALQVPTETPSYKRTELEEGLQAIQVNIDSLSNTEESIHALCDSCLRWMNHEVYHGNGAGRFRNLLLESSEKLRSRILRLQEREATLQMILQGQNN